VNNQKEEEKKIIFEYFLSIFSDKNKPEVLHQHTLPKNELALNLAITLAHMQYP